MSPSGCSWSHGLPRRLRSPTERPERVVATLRLIRFTSSRRHEREGTGAHNARTHAHAAGRLLYVRAEECTLYNNAVVLYQDRRASTPLTARLSQIGGHHHAWA